MWQNEGEMISAEGVRYGVGKLTASRFHRCMGRVPSDEKIPGHTSAEGKCTVPSVGLHVGLEGWPGQYYATSACSVNCE